MRRIAPVIAFVVALLAPAYAQKAEIEAVNATWIECFNKGDFAGLAALYTDNATAFPPGSAMVQGRAAIEAMWKNMAEQITDPKLTTLDVKALGPSAAREIGTFSLKTKGPRPQEVTGKYLVVWGRKRVEARRRYLERRQVACDLSVAVQPQITDRRPVSLAGDRSAARRS